MIVAPERETPGIIDKAWQSPINKDVLHDNSLIEV